MLQTEGSELQNTEQVKSDKTHLNQSLSATINSTTVLTSNHFDIEFSDNTLFNNPLMDSAELYRQIVDTSNEAIWVCDLNSRLVFSNRQGANLLNYTCEELIGRSVFDFVSQEGSSKAENYFERRKQGFNDQYEQKLVRKDGSIVWVTITASPIKDQTGNIVGALGMLNDISQRKIAEIALMKSEEKFSAAFRTSPNCLTISNIDTGILLDVNDTFLSLFECTRQQVIGKNVLDLNLYSNPGERVRIIEILKQKGRVTNYGLKVKVPSGKEKSVRISVEKLPLEDNNVILTTIQDLTELTQVKSNLKQSEELYRNLVDSANSIILRWRTDGTIVYMNDYGFRYFGYSPGDLIGRHAGILIPEIETSGKNLTNLADEIIQNPGKYIQLENENVRKNGERVWVSWTNKAIGKEGNHEILAIGNDITHLKKTKEALRIEHGKLQAIIQNMGIGVIVTDSHGDIITLNAAAMKIHDYQSEEEFEARKNKYFEDFELRTFGGDKIPFEDWPNLQAIGGNFVKSYNALLVNRRSNSSKYLNYNVSPVYDDNNKLKYTIFNITDLSEIRKMNEELNIRVSEMETILGCIPDALIVYDTEARIVKSNLAAEKIFHFPEKYKSSDPVQRANTYIKVWNQNGVQLRPEEMPGYRSAIKGETVANEVLLLDAFGKKNWYSINAVPVKIEGKHSGAVLSMYDITSQKNNEYLLREKEERFRALADNMSQMGWIADRTGKVIWLNKRWHDYTGMDIESIYKGDYLKIHHPDYVEDMRKSYSASISSGEPWEATIPIRSKTGDYRWFLARALPIRDEKDNINLWFGTNTDITEQRLHEETLQKQNIELQKAKEKAEESVKFKNAFIANISHEIRTPMSGILGFADLLKAPDLSSESKNTYIDTIISSGKRMLGIINDLIYISKIEAGHLETYKDATDLYKLLDELRIFFQPEARRKNLELRINEAIPQGKTITETDKTKLSQVLTNLIKNAIKYTNTGYVEFGCHLKEDFYIFYVKDSGIGIKEEYQINIFERFKQGEVATDALEGLGLGLAISKSLVEALGGTIWVESEPGAGSTFYFSIPYKEHENPVNSNIPNNTDLSLSFPELEILIAEDEEFIYYFLDQFLKKNNIKTLHAKNGREAIEMTKANPNIRLILMDSRMPIMNGLEATIQINQFRPDLPIIALSAFASSADVQKTLKAGCVDYIVKPFEKEIVLKKILMYTGNSITHQT